MCDDILLSYACFIYERIVVWDRLQVVDHVFGIGC